MPGAVKQPQTLYDKVLEAHIVDEKPDGTLLLYIDRHLVHEVSSRTRRSVNFWPVFSYVIILGDQSASL